MSDFSNIVELLFDDTARSHGYAVAVRGRDSVVYRSRKCEITFIYDDQRSFEVGADIRLIGDKREPAYNFEEMLRALSVPVESWPSGYFAENSDRLRKLLTQMVEILSTQGRPLLAGDASSWSLLVAQREADCTRYAAETRLAATLRNAAVAWTAGDYARVAALLRKEKHSLSESDLAKLAYAEKQSGGARKK